MWIPNTSPVLVLHTLGFPFESEPHFQRWSGRHFSYARGFGILPQEAEKGDVPWRTHWAGIVMEWYTSGLRRWVLVLSSGAWEWGLVWKRVFADVREGRI